jgi:hypothetical protein
VLGDLAGQQETIQQAEEGAALLLVETDSLLGDLAGQQETIQRT